MKISKIILSVFSAAAMLLTLTACSDSKSSSEKTSGSTSISSKSPVDESTIPESPADDFEYEYKEELGGIVITEYNGKKEVVRIPAKIDEKKVTKIGESAFEGCVGITSVIIPNSVTEIGERAFYCYELTSITIPDSVTYIGEQAFSVYNNATITYKGKTYSPDNYDELYKAINGN